MGWYEDAGTRGMQIIWRNPAPPGRSRSKPRLLTLDAGATIYVAGSPNVEAVFELISGGNLAKAGELRMEEVCEQWGRKCWRFLSPNPTREHDHNPQQHQSL